MCVCVCRIIQSYRLNCLWKWIFFSFLSHFKTAHLSEAGTASSLDHNSLCASSVWRGKRELALSNCRLFLIFIILHKLEEWQRKRRGKKRRQKRRGERETQSQSESGGGQERLRQEDWEGEGERAFHLTAPEKTPTKLNFFFFPSLWPTCIWLLFWLYSNEL